MIYKLPCIDGDLGGQRRAFYEAVCRNVYKHDDSVSARTCFMCWHRNDMHRCVYIYIYTHMCVCACMYIIHILYS